MFWAVLFAPCQSLSCCVKKTVRLDFLLYDESCIPGYKLCCEDELAWHQSLLVNANIGGHGLLRETCSVRGLRFSEERYEDILWAIFSAPAQSYSYCLQKTVLLLFCGGSVSYLKFIIHGGS